MKAISKAIRFFYSIYGGESKMVKKSRILWALPAIMLVLSIAAPAAHAYMPVEAANPISEYGIYSSVDVKVINNIIENNGLKLPKWNSGLTPPAKWDYYVSWNDAKPKRIEKLYINFSYLSNAMMLAGCLPWKE